MAALSHQGGYEFLTSEFQPFDFTGSEEKIIIVYLLQEPTSEGYVEGPRWEMFNTITVIGFSETESERHGPATIRRLQLS